MHYDENRKILKIGVFEGGAKINPRENFYE